MSKAALGILTNKEVIAIDQDSLGIQGFRQTQPDSLETWYKPFQGGDWAVCFFNRGSNAASIRHDWKKEVIRDEVTMMELDCVRRSYALRDLWKKKKVGRTANILVSTIASHDVLMLRLVQ
jgi:alpha-galactosidase